MIMKIMCQSLQDAMKTLKGKYILKCLQQKRFKINELNFHLRLQEEEIQNNQDKSKSNNTGNKEKTRKIEK